MIHIAPVTLVDCAAFFHETTSLVAVGSSRNLFWLAVKITVFLGVVPCHGQRETFPPAPGEATTPPGFDFTTAPPADLRIGFFILRGILPFLSCVSWLQPQSFERFMFRQSSTGAQECLRASGMWEPFPIRLS